MINHRQAWALLDAGDRQPADDELVTLLAVMDDTALQSGETVTWRRAALSLPVSRWGEPYDLRHDGRSEPNSAGQARERP